MHAGTEKSKRTTDQHLEQLLAARGIPAQQIGLVVDQITDFFVDASVIVHFPVGISISGGPRAQSLRVPFIWPAAVPSAERPQFEPELREAFDRDVAARLGADIACEFSFTDNLPAGDEDTVYVGPRDYERLVESMRATGHAAERGPEVAQEIFELVQSYPQKSPGERPQVALRLQELAARLRSL